MNPKHLLVGVCGAAFLVQTARIEVLAFKAASLAAHNEEVEARYRRYLDAVSEREVLKDQKIDRLEEATRAAGMLNLNGSLNLSRRVSALEKRMRGSDK